MRQAFHLFQKGSISFLAIETDIIEINRLAEQGATGSFDPTPECIEVFVVSGVLNCNIVTDGTVRPLGFLDDKHTTPAIARQGDYFAFRIHNDFLSMRGLS